MKAYIEESSPLLDRPEYVSVWKWEWNASYGWYDSFVTDKYVGPEGFKWRVEN